MPSGGPIDMAHAQAISLKLINYLTNPFMVIRIVGLRDRRSPATVR